MTDWTTLPNAAVGVGGLPSGTTVTALRDNPVAIAEGAPGAPRLYLRSLEQLEAGDQIRSRNDGPVTSSDGANVVMLGFGFIQSGTIRATCTKTSTEGAMILSRTRNGALVELLNVTATGTQTIDVDVLPGDLLSWVLAPPGVGTVTAANARFMTNGQDLWPGSSARLEGNRAAT